MKRILSLLLMVVFACVALVGCGGSKDADKKQASGMESDNPSIVKRFIEKLFP